MRTVQYILTNPVYCTADEASFDYFTKLGSDVCFEREKADGKHKPIITSEEWIKAHEIISGNAGNSFYLPARNQVSVFSDYKTMCATVTCYPSSNRFLSFSRAFFSIREM